MLAHFVLKAWLKDCGITSCLSVQTIEKILSNLNSKMLTLGISGVTYASEKPKRANASSW